VEPRRSFLSRLAGLPFLTIAALQAQGQTHKQLKIMMRAPGARTTRPKRRFRFRTDLRSPRRDMRCRSFFLAKRWF
jgi:hypothetical protein